MKNHHSTLLSDRSIGKYGALKPATLKILAELLGVSATTVSRSLIDHPSISAITKIRVKELALKIGYEPSRMARSIKNGRSYTIGIIVPDLGEYFFAKAITAIQDVAMKTDYMVFVAQSHDSEEKEIQLVERMKKLGVDGLLVALSKNTTGFGHFTKTIEFGIPIVFFDRVPPLFNIHSVCCNIETATFEAVQFLAKRGHHRIGIINGPENMLSSMERRKGFLSAIDMLKLSFSSTLYVECDLGKESVEKSVDELMRMSCGPSAIIAFNDYVALFAIRKLRSENRYPRQVDFVSFSNLPFLVHVDHGPIASIEQYPDEQGKIAAQILTELIDGKDLHFDNKTRSYKSIVLDGTLILKDENK